ncbi:C-type lectin domain family 4 member K-like [Mytilus trossulus]|uniref:C-type lectin domain family 4 member K-like n=1 Tax=Mytilus trossulus TaxID=6551 RepID=UPI003006A9EF
MEIVVVVTLSFLVYICNGNVFGPSTQSAAEADTTETGIHSDINVLKDNMHELLKRVSKNENEIASLKKENQYLTNELENTRRQFQCEINMLHENCNGQQQLLNDTKTKIMDRSSSFKETMKELKNRVDKLERVERKRSDENKTEWKDKPVQASCGNGWKRHANNCYYFSTSSANWTESKRNCMQNNSRLADTLSRSEIDFLKNNTAKYKKNFWLDGTDESEEGVWVWATSGQKFTINDWHSSEPNNYGDAENCLNMHKNHDYQWNDAGCSQRLSYICKKPLM